MTTITHASDLDPATVKCCPRCGQKLEDVELLGPAPDSCCWDFLFELYQGQTGALIERLDLAVSFS